LPPGRPSYPSVVVIPVVVIVIAIIIVIVVILVAIVVVIIVAIVIPVVIIIVVVLVTAGLIRILTVMVTLVVFVQGRTMRWRGADDRGIEDVSPGSRQQAWHADDRDQKNGHHQHANSPHGPHLQMY